MKSGDVIGGRYLVTDVSQHGAVTVRGPKTDKDAALRAWKEDNRAMGTMLNRDPDDIVLCALGHINGRIIWHNYDNILAEEAAHGILWAAWNDIRREIA